jgi:hypothetical protein
MDDFVLSAMNLKRTSVQISWAEAHRSIRDDDIESALGRQARG